MPNQADIRQREGTLELYFSTCNASFEDNPRAEIARQLREIADRFEASESFGNFYETIFDANGNDIGRVKLHGVRS